MPREPSPKFVRPAFLDEHNLRTDTKTGEGSFVMVRGIPAIDLPPEASKKFPEGFVMKQYKPVSRQEEAQLFGTDNLSLEEKRKELIARHKAIRDYFNAELPKLVLKKSVLIGKDRKKNELGLYELQEKIAKYAPVFSDYYLVDNTWAAVEKFNQAMEISGDTPWLERWKETTLEDIRSSLSLTAENRRQLAAQLRAFIHLAEAMPGTKLSSRLHDRYIDIRGDANLLITRQGELKLIDTNFLYERGETDMSVLLWREFKARLATLKQLADFIEADQPPPPSPPRS